MVIIILLYAASRNMDELIKKPDAAGLAARKAVGRNILYARNRQMRDFSGFLKKS
jgi:hypothetical protein